MTNLLLKVLENGREKFRHSSAETADFTMLTVSGTPTNPNDVLKEQQLGPTVTAVGQRNTWELAALTTANAANKYFTQNTTTGEYYVWYNLDSGGTDPLVSGKTGIPVAISTGDDAAAITQKTSAALEAHAAFTSTYLGTVVTIDDANPGAVSGGPSVGTLSGLISGYVTVIGVDARLGGIATLNSNGKLEASQIPAIAITDTFVVADEAAMLALSTAETGDVAIRTDLNKSFILSGTYSTLADWKELLSPTDAVSSVNGQTGAVSLDTDDISQGSTNLYFTESGVRGTVLTGLDTGTSGEVLATDTVLQAFGKLANAGTVSSEYKTYTNDEAVAITIGQIVYINSSNHVSLAQADSFNHCGSKLGIVRDNSIGAGSAGKITISTGSIAIIATGSILNYGQPVYLSPSVPGGVTQTCPSGVGEFIVRLGEAVADYQIDFRVTPAIEIAS